MAAHSHGDRTWAPLSDWKSSRRTATVYSDDVEMVTLPVVEGQIGILPQHVPLLTQMVPGEQIVRKRRPGSFSGRGRGRRRNHGRTRVRADRSGHRGREHRRGAGSGRRAPEGRGQAPRKVVLRGGRRPSTRPWLARWHNCPSSGATPPDTRGRSAFRRRGSRNRRATGGHRFPTHRKSVHLPLHPAVTGWRLET